MSIRKPNFHSRILIVFSVFLAVGFATVGYQTFEPLRCTVLPPTGATTPTRITCDRPITITPGANDTDGLTYFSVTPRHFLIRTASTTLIYDQLDARHYVVSPTQQWQGGEVATFKATPAALLPFPRRVSLVVPPVAPIVLFIDTNATGSTSVKQVTRREHTVRVDPIITLANVHDIAYDGAYTLSYVKPDPTASSTAIATFDLLANQETIFQQPLLGKTYTAFAPSGYGSDYAWIERDASGTANAFLNNGNNVTYSVRDTSKLTDSFQHLVYSSDGERLLLINTADDRAYIIGLARLGSLITSPPVTSPLTAAGFLGLDQSIPFIATASSTFEYVNQQWQRQPGGATLAYFMCDAGYGYFDSLVAIPPGCTKLTVHPHTLIMNTTTATSTLYRSTGTLQWVNANILTDLIPQP